MAAASKRARSKKLLAYALTFPGAWEDTPWGDTVVKVAKKIFVFVDLQHLTVKLPQSCEPALSMRCSAPTGYGLGKAAWVTINLTHADCPPLPVLRDWIDESYRAIAPKKLVAELR